jgi:ZIP family zinc transporter
MVVLFSILPFVSTSLGGLTAIRLRHGLHPIMAFASGVLVATALADLLPEAGELLGENSGAKAGAAAIVGYLVFTAMEAFVHRQSWEHQHQPDDHPDEPHEHNHEHVFGLLAATGLIFHSVMDGLAIGLGFRVDTELGLLVALAVLAHDFADGMNVATLVINSGHRLPVVATFLALDALAPPVGAVIGSTVNISQSVLGTLLAIFSGVFISVGAGHLFPEAQHRNAGTWGLISLAALGAAIVLFVRTMIG